MKLLRSILVLGCSLYGVPNTPTLAIKNHTLVAYYVACQDKKRWVYPQQEVSLTLEQKDNVGIKLRRSWPNIFHFLTGRYEKLRTKDNVRGLGLRVKLEAQMPQQRGDKAVLTITSPCPKTLIAALSETSLLPV